MDIVPEFAEIVRKSRTSMSLWIELHLVFDAAGASGDLLRERIMRFAQWCFKQPGVPFSAEVHQAVCCAFIEHVVESRENWSLFKKYFGNDEIVSLRPLWEYNFGRKTDEFINDIFAAKALEDDVRKR